MAAVIPWATAIGACLAESRRNGAPFEDAWRAAEAAYPPPPADHTDDGWLDSTVKFAKTAFRDGYLRRGAGTVGALAERDHADPAGKPWARLSDEPPARVSGRCGWGAINRCDKPGAPLLCAEHAAIIDAIPPLCKVGVCGHDAMADGRYCSSHRHLERSNLRGNAARHGRLEEAA